MVPVEEVNAVPVLARIQKMTAINGILTGPFDTPRIDELDRARAERDRRPFDEVHAERMRDIPADRLGQPDELATLAAYLCSEAAAFQTGTFTLLDGGMVRAL